MLIAAWFGLIANPFFDKCQQIYWHTISMVNGVRIQSPEQTLVQIPSHGRFVRRLRYRMTLFCVQSINQLQSIIIIPDKRLWMGERQAIAINNTCLIILGCGDEEASSPGDYLMVRTQLEQFACLDNTITA
jgi:hypothetical protein